MVPARVSKSRCRYPLRRLVRSGLATPYSAPQTASASAESNVLMNEPSSSRNRSGLAWARCSSSIRAGSILGLTVIVVSFFESVFADHSKDHPVAVAYFDDTLTRDPYTTLLSVSLFRSAMLMVVLLVRSTTLCPGNGGLVQ